MHIALATDRIASIGGIETHVATLAEELCRMGHQISILFPNIVEPEVFAHAIDAGARLVQLAKSSWPDFVLERRVDLFHAHSAGATDVAVTIGRRLSLPVVTTVHGPGQHIPATCEKMGVIFVSREIERAKARPGLPSIVIENGVNIERFRPEKGARPSGFVIMYLGRVGPSKQVGVLSLKRAVRNLPSVSLRFVSTWTPSNQSTATARPEKVLPQADLVFSTGRGVREAMAAGTAVCVLGTYMDGLVTPENVESLSTVNFSGRLTMQLPEAHRIQSIIRTVFDRPSFLDALKTFGRDYAVKHFDSKQMARLTEAFYHTISAS